MRASVHRKFDSARFDPRPSVLIRGQKSIRG